MPSPITTHILDTALGRPAEGVRITLERRDSSGNYTPIANGNTDSDGRIANLMTPGTLEKGVYRMHFDTGGYFASLSTASFYPYVEVVFEITSTEEHYHVPLLLNPYGYSTYRGS